MARTHLQYLMSAWDCTQHNVKQLEQRAKEDEARASESHYARVKAERMHRIMRQLRDAGTAEASAYERKSGERWSFLCLRNGKEWRCYVPELFDAAGDRTQDPWLLKATTSGLITCPCATECCTAFKLARDRGAPAPDYWRLCTRCLTLEPIV